MKPDILEDTGVIGDDKGWIGSWIDILSSVNEELILFSLNIVIVIIIFVKDLCPSSHSKYLQQNLGEYSIKQPFRESDQTWEDKDIFDCVENG